MAMMMTLNSVIEIAQPAEFGSKFKVQEPVRFRGQCQSSAKTILLTADRRFPLGNAVINNGQWSFDYPFSRSGLRRVEAVAFDGNGQMLGLDFVEILIQPPALTSARKQLVSVAASQVGRSETSRNAGPQIKKYFDYCGHSQDNDWCFMFLNWVYFQALNTEAPWGKGMAWVPSIVSWAKQRQRWIRENDIHGDGFAKGDPQPGDFLVIGDHQFVSSRDNYPHIEMVVEVTPTVIRTIGGNVRNRVSENSNPRQGEFGPWPGYIAGYVRTLA